MDVKNTAYDDMPFFDDLVRFYEQSPLTLPGVDIFYCGSAKKMKRLAALVSVLCIIRGPCKLFRSLASLLSIHSLRTGH